VNPVVKSIACRRATRLIDRRCVAQRASKFSATLARLARVRRSAEKPKSYAQFTPASSISDAGPSPDNVVGNADCDERLCGIERVVRRAPE
jgi:hypothetical protein